VNDIVILTGDIHSSWAHDLVFNPNDPAEYDPVTGRGCVGVEIVTPAITSPGIPTVFLGLVEQARPFNQHIRYSELTKRGFVILDITAERLQGAWYHFEDIITPERVTPALATAWSVKSGEKRLSNDPAVAPPRLDPAPPAP
jgi:alkaline phosphatase D